MEIKVNFQSSIGTSHFQNKHKFKTNFKSAQPITVYPEGGPYTGSYEITPDVEGQTLPTAKKLMQEDMTIKAIPYYDVSNTAGGSTVYIGSEV